MTAKTRFFSFLIVAASSLFLAGTLFITTAQDGSCAARLEQFYTTASEACLGKAEGNICNGGSPPLAEPTGPVANSLAPLGALVPVTAVTSLTTTGYRVDGSSGGLAWLRADGPSLHGLLIGDVTVRNATPADSEFPMWQIMNVATAETDPGCIDAPRNTFSVQNALPGVTSRIAINGSSIDLLGTVAIQTTTDETIFMALSGQARVIAAGADQVIVAGQQTRVGHSGYTRATTPPTIPAPFDGWRLTYFPVEMLDRGIRLPQPGFASTEGLVNLRSVPSINGALVGQLPANITVTILGRNPTGDWYHISMPSGETGWVFAELLRRNHGPISAVYAATPQPPQRYGDLGTKAQVKAPAGVNLRDAPDANFSAISSLGQGANVELLARSPYSPWVKILAPDGVIGWVALISLDTQAIIASLPIDYDVPPPPEPPPPTRVPGSWGGAFPDPNCYPNCD
jgi:SH3-like domain-containing protein